MYPARLNLAVLPGAVRLDEDLFDVAAVGANLTKRPAVGHALSVISCLNPGDAVRGEVVQGPVQERCTGRPFSSGRISE